MDMTRRFAPKVVSFGTESSRSIESESEFTALLTELGCQIPLADLRAARDERFRRFHAQLRDAEIDETDIF